MIIPSPPSCINLVATALVMADEPDLDFNGNSPGGTLQCMNIHPHSLQCFKCNFQRIACVYLKQNIDLPVEEHFTPTSFLCPQLSSGPHPRLVQLDTLCSFPVQETTFNHIGPLPSGTSFS